MADVAKADKQSSYLPIWPFSLQKWNTAHVSCKAENSFIILNWFILLDENIDCFVVVMVNSYNVYLFVEFVSYYVKAYVKGINAIVK